MYVIACGLETNEEVLLQGSLAPSDQDVYENTILWVTCDEIASGQDFLRLTSVIINVLLFDKSNLMLNTLERGLMQILEADRG